MARCIGAARPRLRRQLPLVPSRVRPARARPGGQAEPCIARLAITARRRRDRGASRGPCEGAGAPHTAAARRIMRRAAASAGGRGRRRIAPVRPRAQRARPLARPVACTTALLPCHIIDLLLAHATGLPGSCVPEIELSSNAARPPKAQYTLLSRVRSSPLRSHTSSPRPPFAPSDSKPQPCARSSTSRAASAATRSVPSSGRRAPGPGGPGGARLTRPRPSPTDVPPPAGRVRRARRGPHGDVPWRQRPAAGAHQRLLQRGHRR
jgi:hypothetical protein